MFIFDFKSKILFITKTTNYIFQYLFAENYEKGILCA